MTKATKRLIIAIPFLVFCSSVFGAELFVPIPYATIQAGINAASNGDTVIVSLGTYNENINFNGKAVILGSLFYTTQNTSYISQTIIDGCSNGTVITFENGEDSSCVLSGFTIANSNSIETKFICIDNSSPSIEKVISRYYPVRETPDTVDIVDNDCLSIPSYYSLPISVANPFSPRTTIYYKLPESSYVIIEIFTHSLITSKLNRSQ